MDVHSAVDVAVMVTVAVMGMRDVAVGLPGSGITFTSHISIVAIQKQMQGTNIKMTRCSYSNVRSYCFSILFRTPTQWMSIKTG